MDSGDYQQIQETFNQLEEKYYALFNSMNQGFCICEMLVDEDGKPYDYRFLEVNPLFEGHTGLKGAAGKTALELLPNLESHWIEIYGQVALTGTPLQFEQGSAVMGRWFDVYAFRFGQPEDRKFGIIFRDVSEQKRAMERSQLLRNLASALSQGMSWHDITNVIIRQGLEGLGVAGSIAILSEDKTHLQIIAASGYPPDVVARWERVPLGHPTAPMALAVRENRRLWLRSPEEREQIIPMTPNLSPAEKHVSWAALPFNINDELIGAVGLGFNRPQSFDEADQNFLITLTEYCAQALHRAKLTEQIALHAAAQERQRLARDLHDSVKQLLFASSTLSESLGRIWERSPEKAPKYTADIVKLNRAALAELQSLLFEMRPEAIVTAPFMTLVKNLCDGLRGHKAITINLDYSGPEPLYLPAEVHIALYRLTQEALHNIHKHSEATQIDIACSYNDNLFRLTIRDNGAGFAPEQISSGMGLNTMRERAAAIGAAFSIKSAAGEGTEIAVEWAASLIA